MFLKSIVFTENKRCFNENETFHFEPLTLLVGDQGSGKSTLLQELHDLSSNKESSIKIELFNPDKGTDIFYFDSEKHNPRINDPIMYTNPDGTDKGIGVASAIKTRFQSHGEILVNFTVNAIKKANNCIVLLDEPESGLSLRNQYKLTKSIEQALERNCQFIVSTHCLPLIESTEFVLSLEHRKWMESNEFIQTQITS